MPAIPQFLDILVIVVFVTYVECSVNRAAVRIFPVSDTFVKLAIIFRL